VPLGMFRKTRSFFSRRFIFSSTSQVPAAPSSVESWYWPTALSGPCEPQDSLSPPMRSSPFFDLGQPDCEMTFLSPVSLPFPGVITLFRVPQFLLPLNGAGVIPRAPFVRRPAAALPFAVGRSWEGPWKWFFLFF